MRNAPIIGWVIASTVFAISVLLLDNVIMLSRTYLLPLLGFVLPTLYGQSTTNNVTVDLSWHAPNATQVNSLGSAINGTGVYGFIYNSSIIPGDYRSYNWCNMPHVRPQEYPRAPKGYELEYVELVSTVGCHFCSSPGHALSRHTTLLNIFSKLLSLSDCSMFINLCICHHYSYLSHVSYQLRQ